MTNKEVEQKYQAAFSQAVPDVFDAVLESCKNEAEKKAVIITMPRKNKTLLRKLASVAAAIALVLISGFVGSEISKAKVSQVTPETVDSIVSLDVNPSIELLINNKERIIEAKALNKDAKTVIGDMDFKGSDLSVAVNAIIGSMVRNGYIDELSNAILITVDNDDQKKGAKLEKKLSREIGKILRGEGLEGEIISQTVKKDKKTTKLAEEYGITNGKAQLINQIIDKYPKYSFTDLAPLSIHQLNSILSGEKVEIDNDKDQPEKERIGKAKAKEIAITAAKLEKKEIYNYKCELNDENKDLVYIVNFDTDTDAYSYTVNAYSGKIEDSKVHEGTYFGIENAKALALERAGATEDEIKFFNCSFVGDKYGIYFRLGLVDYRISVDANLGEIVSITPKGQTNSNVTQTYINEADVKKIVIEQLCTTEDKITDYKCVLTKNGNLPVFEASCKLPYDTDGKKALLDCTYVIAAHTGEVVGVGKELIELVNESEITPTESEIAESVITESSEVQSSQPESSQDTSTSQ
ncbi:MAG: PepSY domain-containing protein [Clostridia bacterium]|nr:PepSY domain-containing protein [Clostridia bacterium]